MKKRLTGKAACVAILAVLLILSLVDVILRATVFSDAASAVSNYGEVLITAVISALLIVFALKGKNRLFYIVCGIWLGWFVLDHLMGLPAAIKNLVFVVGSIESWHFNPVTASALAIVFQILIMVGIVAMGALLVEYMNDGTICNRAFNVICISTMVLISIHLIIGVFNLISGISPVIVLVMLNNMTRLTTLILFAFFAYDTAKKRLAKAGL